MRLPSLLLRSSLSIDTQTVAFQSLLLCLPVLFACLHADCLCVISLLEIWREMFGVLGMSLALCLGPLQQCDTITKTRNGQQIMMQQAGCVTCCILHARLAEDVQHQICVNCRYGADGWEVVFGYDQEKMMGDRAGAALLKDLKDVDQKQCTPAMSMT